MPPEHEPEDDKNSGPQGPVVWMSLAFALLLIPVVFWWPSFASDTLFWDERTVETVTFSAMGVLLSVMLVFKTRQNESESDVPVQRKFERDNSILVDSGLILILLSLALSANRVVWNLPRELYFGTTFLASSVYLAAVVRSLARERRPIQYVFLMVGIAMVSIVLWRYLSGAASLSGG